MATFEVPTRNQVSENNQQIFDQLEKGVGFVPNLYAAYAYNDTALGDYLALQNRKSTLKAKEREVINLVVSQVNDCRYCQSAHTALGKMNGFTDEQIILIGDGQLVADPDNPEPGVIRNVAGGDDLARDVVWDYPALPTAQPVIASTKSTAQRWCRQNT